MRQHFGPLVLLGGLASWANANQVVVEGSFLKYCDAKGLETSEFMAVLGREHLVDYLMNGPNFGRLSSNQNKLLELALKYRIYSPKIATHHSLLPPVNDIPKNCDTFATLGSEHFCDVEKLKQALASIKKSGSSSPPSSTYGHRLIESSDRLALTIFLYSRVGSKSSFAKFHGALVGLAKSEKINCIYRHIVDDSCLDVDGRLPGFGLQLELQEYFREEIIFEGLTLTPPFGIQDWVDYGLKALQMIFSAENPLLAFSQVSENFPWLAHHLRGLKVSSEVENKARTFAQQGSSLPDVGISINGAPMDYRNLEVAGLLEFVIAYNSLISRHLGPLSDNPRMVDKVAMEIMDGGFLTPAFRFDVRHKAVIYLNNLEKDSEYSGWSREYSSILHPLTSPYYSLARNVVVLVVPLNLDYIISTKLIHDLARLFEDKAAIQVGVVIGGSDEDDVAFMHGVFSRFGRHVFLALLKARSEDQQNSKSYALLGKILSKAGMALDFDEAELRMDALSAAKDSRDFFTRFGIESNQVVFINGKLLLYSEAEFSRQLVRVYQAELYDLQMALLQKSVNDSTDFYMLTLDDRKVAKSRHPDIFSALSSIFVDIIPLVLSSDGWIYAGNSSDYCAYSVLALIDTDRHKDMDALAAWIKMMGSTERKMRLKVEAFGKGKSFVTRIIRDIRDKSLTLEKGAHLIESFKASQQPRTSHHPLLFADDAETIEGLKNKFQKGPLFIVNGHVYGPIRKPLTAIDIESALLYEWHTRAERLQMLRIANDLELNPVSLSAMTIFDGKLQKLLRGPFSYLFPGGRATDLPLSRLNHFRVDYNEEYPKAIQVQAILNPFTVEGAKISAILLELRDFLDILVIPKVNLQYDQIPSPFLYRFRDFKGSLDPILPQTKFSVMMHTPPAWKVREASDEVDFGGMRLSNKQQTITLPIEALIAEVDVDGKGKRSGHLFSLMKDQEKLASEVTATGRGYLQFKAPPGVYKLMQGNKHVENIVLDGLTVNRKQIKVDLFSLDEGPSLENHSDQVNIFIITNSHADERMLGVLMASASRQSKKPLKFWVLDNFLSSVGQRIFSVLAKRRNFCIEYVHVKWPTWLNKPQSRKQRWQAYKILFWDMLPTTRVQRLIYMDPHHIVRGNVAELDRAIIGHAAYGMIPICESSSTPERLKYWKQGAWKNLIKGRPFYATNVIVIDLPSFRRRNQGDRLRTEYQTQGYRMTDAVIPLDQALLNRLAPEVPIHPVVDYWSWCETFCDTKRKPFARLIHFCDTPHRPGDVIEAIQKIAPEWRVFEQEVKGLLEEELKDLQRLQEKVENAPNLAEIFVEDEIKDSIKQEL